MKKWTSIVFLYGIANIKRQLFWHANVTPLHTCVCDRISIDGGDEGRSNANGKEKQTNKKLSRLNGTKNQILRALST